MEGRTEMDREERAERTTKYLVRGWGNGKRKLHFRVLEEKGRSVPFEYHWKRKNIRGVIFERDDLAGAEAWVKQALLAGYTVFHAHNKITTAFGRGLKDWPLPWDWDDERGCWDLDEDRVLKR